MERERDEARGQLAGIEDKMRVELGGHPNSKLWGEAGLIAATMRCVDALDEVTEQRDAVTLRLGNTQERMIDAERQRDRLAKACDQYSEDEILCKLQTVTEQRDNLQMQLDSSCNAEELRQFRAEIAAVTAQRDEAREYADKLAEGLPDGMLPKDVEVLREANLGLATALAAVTEQRDEARKEVGQLKSQLTQTMGAVTISRNGYVQELEQQRDRLAEALRQLCIALLTDTSPDITDLLNKAGAAMAAVNYCTVKKTQP
jgi:hypothetical protein